MEQKVLVAPARYVTIGLAASVTGYTEDAIRGKIKAGCWLENKEWRHGPDGRVLIDLQGYERWAEKRKTAG